MKLRIRFQARREVIDVDNPQSTIADVKEIVRAQFFLSNANFRLSLDCKTPLQTEEPSTLADLGIVGGDLLYIIFEDDTCIAAVSQHSTEQDLQQIGTPYLNKARNITSQEPSTSQNAATISSNANIQNNTTYNTVSGSSNEPHKGFNNHIKKDVQSNQKTAEFLKLRKIEYTPKALLCRDGTPYSLQLSYELANVGTMHEAVCVAVHVLMLETGFLNYSLEDSKLIVSEKPSTSSSINHESSASLILSRNWRTDSGARFLYTHPACPDLVGSVLCTSLGPYILVNGMSTSPSCTEIHQCRLPAADFVKGNIDLKSNNAADVYKNLQRLSLVVKDQIAYPLLSSMRHELNLEEIYGFMALPTEVKLMVLCLLPVKDILNMSATCREMHTISCDHILWQHLCFRDFGLLTKGRHSTWKMEYQRHYKDLIERNKNRFFFPPEPITPHHPAGLFGGYNPPNPVPGIIGGRHDLFPSAPLPGNLHQPRFDPYGPVPDMDINPRPNRRFPGRGRGRGGFPPGPFF